MDEPRYTREEWEEIQAEEWAASRERARGRGDLIKMVHLNGDDIRRLPRVQLLDLLDAKLSQARDSIIYHLKEDADAG